MRALPVAAALTLAMALAGCGEGGDPVQMALRDAAAARQAAAVKEGVTAAPAPTAPAAESGDAAFVARMIEHHEAALELARETLARSADPDIRRMAEAEIETRSREIAQLKAWTPRDGTSAR